MATTETAVNAPALTQTEHFSTAVAAVDELTPFERIVERMKGTGRIVGDVVSPDPEPWDCEVE